MCTVSVCPVSLSVGFTVRGHLVQPLPNRFGLLLLSDVLVAATAITAPPVRHTGDPRLITSRFPGLIYPVVGRFDIDRMN